MNKERILTILLERGYPEQAADVVSGELLHVADELRPGLEEWLADGSMHDYSSNGYSVIELMNSRKMTYPAALLTVDWLIKEPDQALRALQRRKK